MGILSFFPFLTTYFYFLSFDTQLISYPPIGKVEQSKVKQPTLSPKKKKKPDLVQAKHYYNVTHIDQFTSEVDNLAYVDLCMYTRKLNRSCPQWLIGWSDAGSFILHPAGKEFLLLDGWELGGVIHGHGIGGCGDGDLFSFFPFIFIFLVFWLVI